MEKERNEDLHPVTEDVEERVRQMLDPNIPDAPAPKPAKPTTPISIQSVSSPVDDEPSAPLLQETPKPAKKVAVVADGEVPPSQKKSKKVIIPIDHSDAEEKPAKAKKSAVKKITIADHSDDPAAVAEKLQETIAELEPAAESPAPESAGTEAPTAPVLEDEADTEEPAEDKLPKDATIGELADAQKIQTEDKPDDDILGEPAILNDPETDKAVAEIVAAEGDEILEIEDAVRDQEPPKQTKPEKVKKTKAKKDHPVVKKLLKRTVLGITLFGLIAMAVIPTSRYLALNLAGVRATSSMTVVDDQTDQPLKNAQVSIGNVTTTTDDHGVAHLSKLRLGKNQLTVQKSAFAPVTKYVTIGWGSNPLGEVGLTLTGTQYSLSVTDFLSGKALGAVTASTIEADAVADDKGVIKLSIANPGDQPIKVTLKREGYRNEEITIQPTDKNDHPVKMVPALKHTFVSKRSGKADVYTSYIDGKDAKVLLAGSGKERDDMVLAPHPSAPVVAYVSTRAGQTNKAGETLSNLLILNQEDNNSTNVTAAEQIRIIGWFGDRLVYVQTTVDAKADAGDRLRLMSYNYKDSSNKELTKTNFFNDVVGVGNTIYYALSSAYQGGAGLYRVNADGTNAENVYNQEVWNIFRTAYDRLTLSVQQEWYELSTGSKQPTKLNAAPAEQLSRVYIDSPDGKHSLRVDDRDGKGVLLVYDTTTREEKELQSQGGIQYPVRWINDNTVVYRLKTSTETADYAISLDGGQPVKISDVTNTSGINRWLY